MEPSKKSSEQKKIKPSRFDKLRQRLHGFDEKEYARIVEEEAIKEEVRIRSEVQKRLDNIFMREVQTTIEKKMKEEWDPYLKNFAQKMTATCRTTTLIHQFKKHTFNLKCKNCEKLWNMNFDDASISMMLKESFIITPCQTDQCGTQIRFTLGEAIMHILGHPDMPTDQWRWVPASQ